METDLSIAGRDEGTENALGVQGGDTDDVWLTRCMNTERLPYERWFVAMKLPCIISDRGIQGWVTGGN